MLFSLIFRPDWALLRRGERTDTDTDSTSSERVSRFDSRAKPRSEGSVEKILAKSAVIEGEDRESPNDLAVDRDKVRHVPSDQTGTGVVDEVFIEKSETVENQTAVRKFPLSANGDLYREQDSTDKEFSDTVSDRVDRSSMEFLSASDTSDMPERSKGDDELRRMATPDSEQSVASSGVSDGTRKRRKDKSSLRKSKLNESSDGK